MSLYKVRRFEERKKTFFGSFSDKIALNRQLRRLKDYYYCKLLGQENRQLHKPTRQLKLKAIIRRKVMLVQLPCNRALTCCYEQTNTK